MTGGGGGGLAPPRDQSRGNCRSGSALDLRLANLGAARVTERLEDLDRVGVLRGLPFWVPLHGEQERRNAWRMNGLDQAVFRMRDGLDAGAELVQALAVQRVDADFVATQSVAQPAAWLDLHAVNLGVLHFDRIFRVFPVVVETRFGVHLLVDVA